MWKCFGKALGFQGLRLSSYQALFGGFWTRGPGILGFCPKLYIPPYKVVYDESCKWKIKQHRIDNEGGLQLKWRRFL